MGKCPTYSIFELLVISGERQLKEFSTFLQHHHCVLNNIISKNPFITTTNEMNGAEINPVLVNGDKDFLRLQQNSSIGVSFTHSAECIATMDLIHSDNRVLNKTIGVFVELCMEVKKLRKEGTQLLSSIVFTNEGLCELFGENRNQNLINVSSDSQSDKIPLSTNVIETICNNLYLFFEAQQFIGNKSIRMIIFMDSN